MDQTNMPIDDVPTNMQNAAGFSDLRIGVVGNGYDGFDYKLEMGYHAPGGLVYLVDNWVGVKNLPLLGYVRAGHYKPETGLYNALGSHDLSLMEMTASAKAFALGRRIGVSSEHLFANEQVRLFFGVFQSGETQSARYLREDNQGQVVNFRLTAAPILCDEGKKVLHIGGHWAYVGTDNNSNKQATVGVTPGGMALTTPNSLQAVNFACDHYNRGGLEFAYQSGPFSVRSEGYAGTYSAYGKEPNRDLYGAYVELGYFLTGEHRVYNTKTGAFGSPKVKKNFHPFKSGDCNLVDGLGAWQAIFQWSYVDMSDWNDYIGPTANPTRAGHQNDLALGLSWWWTAQMRMVFEYVHSEQTVGKAGVHQTEDIFGTSFRMHF
jgi:phosphate-selective porin OprO/OprP